MRASGAKQMEVAAVGIYLDRHGPYLLLFLHPAAGSNCLKTD